MLVGLGWTKGYAWTGVWTELRLDIKYFYLARYLRDPITLAWVSVGPVERLAGIDAAYLVSPVVAVRHSVTPEAQLDAEAIITSELVRPAHRGTVGLVILAVLDPVTPDTGIS